jgi:hypothetical protein
MPAYADIGSICTKLYQQTHAKEAEKNGIVTGSGCCKRACMKGHLVREVVALRGHETSDKVPASIRVWQRYVQALDQAPPRRLVKLLQNESLNSFQGSKAARKQSLASCRPLWTNSEHGAGIANMR